MDIATFALAVDSRDVKNADEALKKMTATGGKAEKQLNGLGKGSQGLAAGLNNVEKAARSVETTTSRVLRAAAAAGVGLGFGAVITKVARETINAQNEQRQLAAVIRSTGAAAGYSVDQLNEMAEALSNASTFSAGDINRAQTRLLSYTGIVGEVFPRAMQSVIDTSVRMGMSVEQAAETVGRALDIPSQGLTSLSRQGFRFTDSQKALVERLEQVGKVGEAQNIVLQALESSYGGAAFAARNTFGGALAGLQNQIDDLLTGDDDSVYGLTSSINAFTNTLASSETKSAFASFTQNLVDLANSFTTTAAVINGSSFLGWGSLSGDQIDDPAMAIGDIERKISNLERMRSDLDPDKSFVNKLNDFMYGDVGDIDRQLAYLETQKKALMGYLRLADNPILKMYPEGMFGEPSGQGSSPAAGGSGGGAGSKPKKNPDHLGDFMQSMNIDYAMQEYQDYLDFIEDITGRADERILQQQQNWLDNARKTGLITVNEYGDAIDELVERTSKGTSEMDQFAIQAARNIESQIGDTMFRVFKGNFDSIGDSFSDMLARMAADLAASQLSRSLLGDFGSTGEIGGLVGNIFSGLFSGPSASSLPGAGYVGFADGGYTGPGGKYDPAGIVHRGEGVLNQSEIRAIGGEAGFNALRRAIRGPGHYMGGMAGSPKQVTGSAPSVAINLVNQSSQPVQAKQGSMSFDGKRWVQEVILSDLRVNGPIARGMKGAMG